MKRLGLVTGTFVLHISANPRKGRVLVKETSQIHKVPLEAFYPSFLRHSVLYIQHCRGTLHRILIFAESYCTQHLSVMVR